MSKLHLVLREWETVDPSDDGPGLALRGFRFDEPAHRRVAAELTEAGFVRLVELRDGLQIQTRSHIGRVHLGKLTLTIIPKIAAEELLTLFRYAYGLRDVSQIGAARYSPSGELLQDLIIAQLHAEVREVLERGIARGYVERDEELSSPRGRIDFVRVASQHGTVSTRLPCRHHPRSTNHLLNRVVLAGVALGQGLAEDRSLRMAMGRLRQAMAEIADSEALSSELLARARRSLTRLVAPYASIVEMIELLYFGSLLDLGPTRGRQRLPGFLFDMNRFFQALLQRFLSENLSGVRVLPEYGLNEMMRYTPGQNPRNRRTPAPRPDYAIIEHGRVVSLLDAKYRDLWELSLPREMLYQMTVYALSQRRGSTAAILYPATDPGAAPSLVEIREPATGMNAGYVALRPVQLRRMAAGLGDRTTSAQVARERWARELAGLA